MINVVPVQVRHANQSEAVYMCDCPISDLGWLIKTVGNFGVYTSEGESHGVEGQFVVPDNGARVFFEIIVGGQ